MHSMGYYVVGILRMFNHICGEFQDKLSSFVCIFLALKFFLERPIQLFIKIQKKGMVRLVGQVETSPQILLVYRAHLVMIVTKLQLPICCARVRKNCSKLECMPAVEIRATAHALLAVARYSVVHSNGVREPGTEKGCERLEKCRARTRTHTQLHILSTNIGTTLFFSESCRAHRMHTKKICTKFYIIIVAEM
jgi:hypothetical protein